MKKIAMSALMAGALGLSSVAATSPAEAHWRGTIGIITTGEGFAPHHECGRAPNERGLFQ